MRNTFEGADEDQIVLEVFALKAGKVAAGVARGRRLAARAA
jgi:hypothetical protein